MKLRTRRRYSSPLRQAQAGETRERILGAFAELVAEAGDREVSFEELGRRAGVERRTVFRHFPTRADLLAAFWVWINRRLSPQALPEQLEDLRTLPPQVFAGFDRHENIIRASLHTKAGRAMRLAAMPERRRRFRAALAEVSAPLPPSERRALQGVVHLLYSAAAWETLKDYCGMSGREAGRTVAWALDRVLAGLERSRR